MAELRKGHSVHQSAAPRRATNDREPNHDTHASDIMVPTVSSYTLSQHIPDAQLIIHPD